MATSAADICNIALQRLGCASIVNLLDGSAQATALSPLYAPTRDRLLRELEWNFAQFRKTLSYDPTKTPAFGAAFAYPLPTLPLCLKVNETNPRDAVYTIENTMDSTGKILGKCLITSESSIAIRYTGLTDEAQFDPSFVEAFAADLAAQVAYVLTESQSKADAMAKWAKVALEHAQTVDSQENSTRTADVSILVDVRSHGFSDAFMRNSLSI